MRSHSVLRLSLIVMALVSSTAPGYAQSRADEESRALKTEADPAQKLKRRVEASDEKEITVSVDGFPYKGRQTARLTVIEFSDYQCPFCARHFRQTLPSIEKDYVRSGRIKYVFHDFPLESIHKEAFKAAEAAHCAGDQGQYWAMHDRLFADQKALSAADIPLHGRAIGLDAAKFARCLDEGKYAQKVRAAIADARKAGVRSTPTFFLGRAESGGVVKVLKTVRGAAPYEKFKEALEELFSR